MKRKEIILWAAVSLYICWIFSNSLADGDTSGQMSGNITGMIMDLLKAVHINISFDTLHHLIRKGAHFCEYLVLGCLVVYAQKHAPLHRNSLIVILLFMIAVPCCDESIQHFVPERYGAFSDVLLDMCGYITGSLPSMFLIKNRKL
ncbi:MAG TPA: VanZ family protein [Erysipelotrichaceae bacterium]|nr:VanZ family protein [Erysipelotrichaceae bacterium]